MSDIQRLLRVAAHRNKADEYGPLRIRLLRSQIEELRKRLAEDGMSSCVLFEAVVKGYIERHHAVLAMIDQWTRDEQPETRKHTKSLTKRDIADIYAELGCGIISDEEQ